MIETWKDVVGFEGIYEVSNLGMVRTNKLSNHGSYDPGKVLKQCKTPQGYLFVGLWKSGKVQLKTVHSLVLEAFVGPRPFGYVTRHLNRNKENNSLDNLSWGTRKENSDDRKLHGTANCGSRHGMSRLWEDDVLRMRSMSQNGITNVAIAKEFSMTPSNVGRIVKRKGWTHV